MIQLKEIPKMKNKISKIAVALMATILLISASSTIVGASTREQGVDQAYYQGNYGKFGYASDKFSISQIGGHNKKGLYIQSTYKTQVQSTIAQGKRAHSYFWWSAIYTQAQANQLLNFILPKVQTPKGKNFQ